MRDWSNSRRSCRPARQFPGCWSRREAACHNAPACAAHVRTDDRLPPSPLHIHCTPAKPSARRSKRALAAFCERWRHRHRPGANGTPGAGYAAPSAVPRCDRVIDRSTGCGCWRAANARVSTGTKAPPRSANVWARRSGTAISSSASNAIRGKKRLRCTSSARARSIPRPTMLEFLTKARPRIAVELPSVLIDGALAVDRVIRYEHLEAELEAVGTSAESAGRLSLATATRAPAPRAHYSAARRAGTRVDRCRVRA